MSKNNPAHDHGGAYEPSDIHLGRLVALVAGFAIAGIVVLSIAWWLMERYAHLARSMDQPNSMGAVRLEQTAPPLQPSLGHDRLPQEDLAAMRRREDRLLEHLGWQRDPTTHELVVPSTLVPLVASRRSTEGPQ